MIKESHLAHCYIYAFKSLLSYGGIYGFIPGNHDNIVKDGTMHTLSNRYIL